MAWATSTGSLAAPEMARRTVDMTAGSTPGTPAHAAHIVGGPDTIVTPHFWIDSSAETGSKRSTSSTDEPDEQRRAEHDVEPEDVEQRQHAEHDVAGVLVVAARGEHLADVGVQVAVGEHRRPGQARRCRR